MWSNAAMPTAEGHHRPLNERSRPTWATTFPGVVTLRHYQRAWLRGDLLAGVTVAAYLIPQVMAYAQIAGLPPATGLVAVVGPTLAYAVLGSSRQLSVGPESTTALMTAAVLGPLAAGSMSDYAGMAALLALLVGVYAILAFIAIGYLAVRRFRPESAPRTLRPA